MLPTTSLAKQAIDQMNGLGTSQMKNLNKQTSGYCLGIIVWVSASVVVQPVMMV